MRLGASLSVTNLRRPSHGARVALARPTKTLQEHLRDGSFRADQVVYDPAFFARSAEILSARGLIVASLDQRSAPMREAWSQFYEAVNAGARSPTRATPSSRHTS